MDKIKETNYFFFAQNLIRYFILISITFIFYLSYNNKSLLYKPLFFIFFLFLLASILVVLNQYNYLIIYILLVFVFYLVALNVNITKVYNPGVAKERISRIEGYVIKDQSKTKSGSYYFKIDAYKGYLKDGSSISIKGQIPIMFKENYDLLFYTPIRATVEYCEDIDIYKAKEIFVLENNDKLSNCSNKIIFSLRENRIYILKKIKAYIHCPLARMLLLGRSDQEGFIFKEYALNLGCAHLLALSGMHLSIITLFFSSLFSIFLSKSKAKYLSILIIFYFIYITGPIPSLIRSLIMYLLNTFKVKIKVRSEEILLLTGIIQGLILPSTFRSAGCLFSYGALCAIFFYSSIFKDVNKILSSILTTIFAILVTYPLSISMGGSWCILSIILAPVVTIFVTLEMCIALCLLINSILVDFNFFLLSKIDSNIFEAFLMLFTNLAKEVNYYFHRVLRYLERIITFLFEKGTFLNEKLPKSLISNKGYVIFAILVLTSLVVYLYATHSFKFRSYKKNELEFSL